LTEIKEKDSEIMWVWEDENHKYKRKVVAKYNHAYLAFGEIIRLKELFLWPYAEPVITKLSAVVKSAEEITGVKGIREFGFEIDRQHYAYSTFMDMIAGQRIQIIPALSLGYDYSGACFIWLKSWLKDFEKKEI